MALLELLQDGGAGDFLKEMADLVRQPEPAPRATRSNLERGSHPIRHAMRPPRLRL
ncbi:MAG: hypothetical protein ACXW26_18315 [Allosphingosinicella sp.]